MVVEDKCSCKFVGLPYHQMREGFDSLGPRHGDMEEDVRAGLQTRLGPSSLSGIVFTRSRALSPELTSVSRLVDKRGLVGRSRLHKDCRWTLMTFQPSKGSHTTHRPFSCRGCRGAVETLVRSFVCLLFSASKAYVRKV